MPIQQGVLIGMSKGYYDEYIWFADESGNYVDGEQYYESFKSGMSGRTKT